MPDLYVRSDVLDDLRSRLSTVSSRLSGACTVLRRIDGEAVRAPPLVGAVSDFADGWSHGITKIGEYTEGTAQALTQIGRVFDECDTALGRACRPGGGEPGGGA